MLYVKGRRDCPYCRGAGKSTYGDFNPCPCVRLAAYLDCLPYRPGGPRDEGVDAEVGAPEDGGGDPVA